jgi:hypothetical protein
VHAEAEVHDTLTSSLRVPPTGFGAGTMDQDEPFHASASVTTETLLGASDPTAVHAEAEVHDTASSALPRTPAGFGVGTMDQDEPSHCSASVRVAPLLFM